MPEPELRDQYYRARSEIRAFNRGAAKSLVRLELRDLAADGRERCVEPARRRRKAARFDGRQQDLHRFKAIHQCYQNSEGFLPFVPSTLFFRMGFNS